MNNTLVAATALCLGVVATAALRGEEPMGGRVISRPGGESRLVALDNFFIVDVNRIVSAQYSGQQNTLSITFADVTGEAATVRYEGDTATRKWKALQRYAEQ